MSDELTRPIELGEGIPSGKLLVELHEVLCKRDEVSWLRFRLTAESDGSGPKYKLTAQWKNGPEDPPQPGPRVDLVHQIAWLKGFVAGWVSGLR